jgi:cytochrome c5
MKYKVIALAVLSSIIYSCASKSSIPTTEVKKEEVKTSPMTSELTEGMYLYENNCAKCHKLYSPNDFNAEEWKTILARMQKQAQLTDLDGQKVYNYVTMK